MKKIITLTLLLSTFFFAAKAQVTANAGADQEVCLNDTVKAIGTGLPSGDTGSYQWRRISTNQIVSTTFELKLRITSGSTEQFELKVTRIKNNVTYTDLDTFDLKINLLPTIAYKGIPALCYKDCPYPLTGNYIAVGSAGYDPTVKDSSLRYYQKKSMPWVSGGSNANDPYFLSFCNYISNAQLPSTGARDTICFDYTDPKGCYVSQCRPVRYYPNPIVELQDLEVCIKNAPFSLNSMVVKPFNKTGGIETYRCLSVPATSSLDKNTIITSSGSPAIYVLNTGTAKDTQDVGKYVIEYCFKNAVSGCQTCDTANVNVKRYGQAYIDNLPKACINGAAIELDSFVRDKFSGVRLTGCSWSCVEYSGSRDRSIPNVKLKLDSSVKNNKFIPATGAGQYMLKCVTDPNACAANDSIYIIVNGLPVIQISVPDTVCADAAAFNLNNVKPAGQVGTWSGPGVSGRKFVPGSVTISSRVNGPYQLHYTYTNPLTLCTASDSQKIVVMANPQFKPKAVVRKILGQYLVSFSLDSLVYVDSSQQKGQWNFGNGKSSDYFTYNNLPVKDSGIYKAYFTINNGPCQYTDSVIYELNYKTTGISAIEHQVSIYPNPIHNNLQIAYPADAQIVITNILGIIVYQGELSAGQPLILDTTHLSAGQYIIQVNNASTELRKLIIKY